MFYLIPILIPFCCCLLVFIVAGFFLYKKPDFPIKKITAFGAGVLASLLLFKFLPMSFSADWIFSVTEYNSYFSLILILSGFLVNFFAEIVLLPKLKFLNKFLPSKKSIDCSGNLDHHHHYHLPSLSGCSALSCFILCAFFDGLRLASADLIDLQTTLIVGLGLLLHLIPESITVAGIGLSAGFSRKGLFKVMSLFCLSFLLGNQLFFQLSHWVVLQKFAVPFASGLFLYVCSIHLLPMVFKFKVKRWFFAGIVLFAVVEAVHLLLE